jgi:hypothetical protein
MNRSAKREHHERARRRHKRELEAHAREVAKRPPAKFPRMFLILGITAMLALVLGVTFLR